MQEGVNGPSRRFQPTLYLETGGARAESAPPPSSGLYSPPPMPGHTRLASAQACGGPCTPGLPALVAGLKGGLKATVQQAYGPWLEAGSMAKALQKIDAINVAVGYGGLPFTGVWRPGRPAGLRLLALPCSANTQ